MSNLNHLQRKLDQRRSEFKNMLENIHREHSNARNVVSASWIRSTASYRQLFPQDLDEPTDLMSPDIHFAGDSIWGQFTDRYGNVNERVYIPNFLKILKQHKLLLN